MLSGRVELYQNAPPSPSNPSTAAATMQRPKSSRSLRMNVQGKREKEKGKRQFTVPFCPFPFLFLLTLALEFQLHRALRGELLSQRRFGWVTVHTGDDILGWFFCLLPGPPLEGFFLIAVGGHFRTLLVLNEDLVLP